MKKIVLLSILMFGFVSLMGQTEIKSKLDKVTVYRNKALVEKSVKINLQKGENKFIITNNATNISENNVHFYSSEDWFITSMNTKKQHLPDKEAAKKVLPQSVYQQYLVLKNKLDNLEAQKTDINTTLRTLNAQKTALDNMKAIKNIQTIDTVSIIKSQFNFQREEKKNINKMISESEEKLSEISYQYTNTLNEIETLIKKYIGGNSILTDDNYIFVTIYSNLPKQNEVLKYSYTVSYVQSHYSYDVMLDENLNKATFYLKNNVQQATGENWKDCEIVFSTSNGEYDGFDQELPTYYLDYNTNMYKNNIVKGKTRNTVTALKESKVVEEEEEEALYEVGYDAGFLGTASMQNLSINKEYTLSTPQSIGTYEQALTIPLYSEQTNVTFSRFTTPKNEEKVFYTALLPDWEDLGLLETDCDVYLNNKFISNSFISTEGTGDTMRFSVGDDKNIKVSRKLRKTSPTEKGFLSKDIIETANITLTLKNTKNEEVEISVKDQIPISSNSEIKISDVELAGGTLNANTGVIRWNVKLAPKEEKKITFSYTVKYPKGNKVILN